MSRLIGFRDNETGDARANVQPTPPPILVNLATIGSLVTHQILAKLVDLILRYGGGGARTEMPHPPMACGKYVLSDPPPPNLNTIGQADPEIQKCGLHVHTCRDTPPTTCVKHLVHDPQLTHQNWTQSAKPILRYRSASARAHVQIPHPWLC